MIIITMIVLMSNSSLRFCMLEQTPGCFGDGLGDAHAQMIEQGSYLESGE